MAKACYKCGKSTVSGSQISHAVNHSKRKWKPNLRSVSAEIAGTSKKILVCARCLRAGKITG